MVVVTARSSDVDQIKGFSGGAIEYITKPFEPRQLLDYVKKALKPKVEELEEEIRQDRIRRLQLSTIYDKLRVFLGLREDIEISRYTILAEFSPYFEIMDALEYDSVEKSHEHPEDTG